MHVVCFFFFKQKTAYEMRISDWSSDVCSSDLYETRIDDLISYDSSIFLPNNIDQARIRGVELTVDTTLAGWDLSAQLSHTDPRNRTRYNPDGSDNANRGNLLARRARNTGRFDVDRTFGKFAFGAS